MRRKALKLVERPRVIERLCVQLDGVKRREAPYAAALGLFCDLRVWCAVGALEELG